MPDDVERHRISCAIFNTKLYKGASITDHVLYMIEQMECLAKLGYPLHEQLGKDSELLATLLLELSGPLQDE